MIQVARQPVNMIHREIIEKAYIDMCERIHGLNIVTINLMDTIDNVKILKGDGEDEGTYIVYIRFSNSLGGFLYELIDALGIIATDSKQWVESLSGTNIGDILFSVYKKLSATSQAAF